MTRFLVALTAAAATDLGRRDLDDLTGLDAPPHQRRRHRRDQVDPAIAGASEHDRRVGEVAPPHRRVGDRMIERVDGVELGDGAGEPDRRQRSHARHHSRYATTSAGTALAEASPYCVSSRNRR